MTGIKKGALLGLAAVFSLGLGAGCWSGSPHPVPTGTRIGTAVIGTSCASLGARDYTSAGISVVCRKQGTTSRKTWQVG